MNTRSTIPLAKQRQLLRQQLLAQRQLIAEQLDLAPVAKNGYPRSMTMRFLTQRPALIAKLLTGITTLLVGARMIKSIGAALVLARVVRSVARTRQQKQAPAATSQVAVPTNLTCH